MDSSWIVLIILVGLLFCSLVAYVAASLMYYYKIYLDIEKDCADPTGYDAYLVLHKRKYFKCKTLKNRWYNLFVDEDNNIDKMTMLKYVLYRTIGSDGNKALTEKQKFRLGIRDTPPYIGTICLALCCRRHGKMIKSGRSAVVDGFIRTRLNSSVAHARVSTFFILQGAARLEQKSHSRSRRPGWKTYLNF